MLGAKATLIRWLGPWAHDSARPEVDREELAVPAYEADAPSFPAWLYRPRNRRLRGAYLVVPGLHYAGPADPRLDRFCAVLAASGFAVLAPFLPDFAELRVRTTLVRDVDRALDLLLESPELLAERKPKLFSVSFGSLPALSVAALPHRADAIGHLIVFGGYVDWVRTIEYCLTGCIDGRPHGTRDPLNQPVVFLNLLEHIPDVDEPELLAATWRRYTERTWGRPEMKAPERYHAVAHELATELSGATRDLFLRGCGALPGGADLCRAALERAGPAALLDPRPALPGVRCPVTLVHGLDDDVIPYVQAVELEEALVEHTEVRTYLTGLYDHTRGAGGGLAGLLRSGPLAARELSTLLRIVSALARPGPEAS